MLPLKQIYLALLQLFCLLLVLVIVYIKWSYNYWVKRRVKGPKPQLLSGTFPQTSAGKCHLLEEMHEIYLRFKSSEKLVGLYSSLAPKLFVLDPKLASAILIKHFSHFRNNESSKWTSANVEELRTCSPFVTTDNVWKEKRSELVPVLTANRFRAFTGTLHKTTSKLTQFIDAINTGKPLDVKELAARYTTEFISYFIWGIEAGAFADHTQISTIHKMANSIIVQGLACVNYFERTASWPWFRKLMPVRFFPAATDKFFKQLASDSMEMHMKSTLKHCDVIDYFQHLKDKKSLNEVQIAGHTTTVLIDGFETGAVVITNCLLLLSRNEQAQSKLRTELEAAGSNLSYDELQGLPYLDQCVQESLRIFPPLATLFKLCTESITIQNSDYTEFSFQPNDAIYISAYSFHHDPEYFENPGEFIPERFDEELGGVRKYREMGVFLPFGDGPRMCPGNKLGLFEAKGAIAEVIRNYRVKSAPKTRTENKTATNTFLLTLDGKIELIFEKL